MSTPVRREEKHGKAHPLRTVGVLADSHIPDRRRALQPEILDCFASHEVDLILHAGDICSPVVLAELNKIAPVTAVRGNRDFLFGNSLPLHTTFELGGLQVGLAHGHGGLLHYLVDKGQFLLVGYRYQRYYRYLIRLFPEADVLIFGHTHTPEARFENNRLVFNPGSSCCSDRLGNGPSIGILKIFPEKRIEATLIPVQS